MASDDSDYARESIRKHNNITCELCKRIFIVQPLIEYLCLRDICLMNSWFRNSHEYVFQSCFMSVSTLITQKFPGAQSCVDLVSRVPFLFHSSLTICILDLIPKKILNLKNVWFGTKMQLKCAHRSIKKHIESMFFQYCTLTFIT